MSDIMSSFSLRALLFTLLIGVTWGAFYVFMLQLRMGLRGFRRFAAAGTALAAFLYSEVMMKLNGAGGGETVRLAEFAKRQNMTVSFLFAAALFAILLWTAADLIKWRRDHITNMSVKESLDKLPAGVLCYTAKGMTVAINPVMEEICRAFLGDKIPDGPMLPEKLCEEEREVIETKEGHYYSFRINEFTIDGVKCFCIICDDVSEEHKANLMLDKENERLRVMNGHLKELNDAIDDVVRSNEILRAKVALHDRLGQALLATGLQLKKGGGTHDKEESEKLLKMWRETAGFLSVVPGNSDEDAFAALKKAAEDVGVKLIFNGTEPGAKDAHLDSDERHIFVTAIHECLTNTLKHAGGDELYITYETEGAGRRLSISNNGRAPEGPVLEKGGLKSLRSMVEKYGGSMEISADQGFMLRIIL